ncbi:MAG: hypothetical protein AAF585_10875, partial [Verrucomicrobiota bacterium]
GLSGCETTGGGGSSKPKRVALPPLPELSQEETSIALTAAQQFVKLQPGEFVHVNPSVRAPKLRTNPFTNLGVLEDTTANDFTRKLNQDCLMPEGGLASGFDVDWTGEVTGFLTGERGPGWTGYYQSHPQSKGYVEFSRVGISDDGGQALVYVGHQKGWGEGSGRILLLQRSGASWSIVDHVTLWGSR